MIKKSAMWRGEVIHLTIVLERTLEACLAFYISDHPNKRMDMLELFLDRMTFESVRTSFASMLKRKCSEEEYKKTYKNFIEEIRKIIIQRNYFAHYLLDNSNEAEHRFPKEIGFIEYRDSAKTYWYSQEKYSVFVKKIETIIGIAEDVYLEFDKNKTIVTKKRPDYLI